MQEQVSLGLGFSCIAIITCKYCNTQLLFTQIISANQYSSLQEKVFSIRYPRNQHFVDRPNVFESLDRAIDESKSSNECNPVTLCGLGGMGKSQIALEFCYRNKDKYQFLFWMEADTEVALQNSYVDTARMLNLSTLTATNSANPEDVVPRMIQWLQNNDGWLLVFDNADDYSWNRV